MTISNLDAYHSAIVRIATVRNHAIPEHTYLLFASVELLTTNRPVPDSMKVDKNGIPQTYKSGEMNFDLAFRKVAMDVDEALNWYRSLQTDPRLPIPRLKADCGKYDGKPIQTFSLQDEPRWPGLASPVVDPSLFGTGDDLYPTPFIGAGAHPSQIHRQLSVSNPLLERMLGDQGACEWLQWRVHFNITRHDELLGGAVLVVPDPDVRLVRTFKARNKEGTEYLVGEVQPHHKRSLKGLSFTHFEERFGAVNIYQRFDVTEELMILPVPDQLEQTGYVLAHTERGLIDQQIALPYMRKFNYESITPSRHVSVTTEDDRHKNAKVTEHQIVEVSRDLRHPIDPTEGKSIPRDAASRFYASSERRRAQRLAGQQQMQWFDNRTTALEFIRRQIGSARRSVFIVDPFADGQDLFNFGHFITNREIQLRLLTSRLSFKNDAFMKANFAEAARSFKERDVPIPDVRVLRGRSPPLHDRFLVIDDDIWLSGNSLNNIGERASVMLKLFNASTIIERLERHFKEARILDLEVDG